MKTVFLRLRDLFSVSCCRQGIPLIEAIWSQYFRIPDGLSATRKYPEGGMWDSEAPIETTRMDFQELQTTRVGIEPTTFGSRGPTKAIGLRLTVEATQ